MRITNSGKYEYCRWAQDQDSSHYIQETAPAEYFQKTMQPIRQMLLDGQQPPGCHTCKLMEDHGKVSGRQKQLLKVGARLDEFEKTLASSPWISTFTDQDCRQLPQDWQIDLGNFCNSACIFCSPESSSRLATEWKKIGFIDSLPPQNWSDNLNLVQKFIDILKQSSHIQYLHFIGGETLITPAFEKILRALIDAGLHKTATIGFTTNLTVWNDTVIKLLEQFSSVNLGMSIESFDTVNDYVRWPSCISTVRDILERWESVAKKNSWLLQFRTTPSCLTVGRLLEIYNYALHKNIIVESCNFLYQPEVLKPSVLPIHIREGIIDSMQSWIDKHYTDSQTILNIRNPNTVQAQLVQDLSSYVNYLKNEPDESYQLPELISWMKKIEANRGNSVLTYLPEYEELFRSAGY
jgi:sulfatase maturation enzyme AslB (radical SAM superfamily)